MKRNPLFLALSAAALLLSACSNVLTKSGPPDTTYLLHPVSTEPRQTAASSNPTVLEVQQPGLPAGLDTSQIALFTEGGRRLDHYAGANWAGNLDDVLQNFTVQSTRRAFPSLVVDDRNLDVLADYRLSTKVIDFQPVYSGSDTKTASPELRVNIVFTLVRLPEESVVTHFAVMKKGMANANNLTTITTGLETLLRDAHADAFKQLAPYLIE